jgi:hypothetical protein
MELANILTDRNVFNQVSSGLIDCPDLTTDETKYDAAKRWQIFSRVRFEYVRPTCTLRSQAAPSVLPTMDKEERDYGLKAYINAGLNPDKKSIALFLDAINNPIPDSLGEHLAEYYQSESVPTPNTEASLFPANYIIIHDLHHVLLGADTTQRGEMEIIAFESGMLHKSPAPILLLEQLEIFLSDKTDCIDAANLAKAWNIGANATSLFENWQWQHDLNLPLEEVRNKYAVLPLRRP